MRVFVTGATGFIGRAVVQELIDRGHKVVGLARSEKGAEVLEKLGATVQMGSLEDLERLKEGASICDGIIHLAFTHDFSNFARSLAMDLQAIETMGTVIEGSNKPFIITNHMNGEKSIEKLFSLKGVRTAVVSLAPTVHDENLCGFISQLISIAREKGVSAYVGDGLNRWPSIHKQDAAKLFRLAIEKSPARSSLIGRGEEGIQFIDIAKVISEKLGVPLVSIAKEEAVNHFGFLGNLASLDMPTAIPASTVETKEVLGWNPENRGLIEDMEKGNYFK